MSFCDKKLSTESLSLIVADNPILLQSGVIEFKRERFNDNKSPLFEFIKLWISSTIKYFKYLKNSLAFVSANNKASDSGVVISIWGGFCFCLFFL